jgi:hypothetical protein
LADNARAAKPSCTVAPRCTDYCHLAGTLHLTQADASLPVQRTDGARVSEGPSHRLPERVFQLDGRPVVGFAGRHDF